MKRTVERTCKQCGKGFKSEACWVKHGRGIFCSRKCHNEWRSIHKRGEDHHLWVPRVKRVCLECGHEFERLPKRVEHDGGKFCSVKCFHSWRVKNLKFRGEDSPLWNGGLSYGKYCPKFKPVRDRVRVFFGYRCMMPNCACGNKMIPPGTRPQLDVHHVYYQKEACCYHTEDGKFVFDLGKYGKIEVVGNPTKFVTLCRSANGRVNKDRLYWAKYFENLINTKYGGKSYFTKEEYIKMKSSPQLHIPVQGIRDGSSASR